MYFLRQRTILINLLILTVLWVSCSFNYYLVGFKVKYFPGNINLNQMASILAESLAYIISGCLLSHFNSRWILLVCFTLSAVAGFSILMCDESSSDGLFVFLVLLAKFGIASAFNVVYATHPTRFPTLFSVTSMGFVNFVARLATASSPFVAEADPPTPMLIFTVLCIASVCCTFCLRESHVK